MNTKIISNLIAAGVMSSAMLLAGCDLDFGGSGSDNNSVDTSVDFNQIETTADIDTTNGSTTSTSNSEGELVSIAFPAGVTVLDDSGNPVDLTGDSLVSSVELSTAASDIDATLASEFNAVTSIAGSDDTTSTFESLAFANFGVKAKTAGTEFLKLSEAADVQVDIQDNALKGVSASDLSVWAYVPAADAASIDTLVTKKVASGWKWVRIQAVITIDANGKIVIKFKTKISALFSILKKKPKQATGSGSTTGAGGN